MLLKSVCRFALLGAALGMSLAGCEEKKTFKHDADWPSPLKATPRAIHTETAEGAAEAIETRLDDILLTTRDVYSEPDARAAVDKMKKAYADLETYYGALKTQEPKADGPNRQAVARAFFKTQQELAKSIADLFERNPKIVEVIGAQLETMTLVQNPPDPLPQEETPGQGIEKEIPVPDIDNPKFKQGAKPKTK